MPRSKPYTGGLAFFDLFMLACTCGMWIFIMLVRELNRWS